MHLPVAKLSGGQAPEAPTHALAQPLLPPSQLSEGAPGHSPPAADAPEGPHATSPPSHTAPLPGLAHLHRAHPIKETPSSWPCHTQPPTNSDISMPGWPLEGQQVLRTSVPDLGATSTQPLLHRSWLRRLLGTSLGMQGEGPLQRYSGRYITMQPEEFAAYFPESFRAADDIGADVSTGKSVIPSSGFHQLLVVAGGHQQQQELRRHQQQQEQEHPGAIAAAEANPGSPGAKHLLQQQLQHQQQQPDAQHINVPDEPPQVVDLCCWGSGVQGHGQLLGPAPTCFSNRSIFGLPTIPTNSSFHAAWLLLMLFVDVTYTAFVNPVLITVGWIHPFNEAWILEAIFGAVFAADLIAGFHVQYAVRCRFTRRFMTDGRGIARYYTRHGQFPLALLSALPWVLLMGVQLPWVVAKGGASETLTIVLQVLTGVRILRLWRLLHMVYGFYSGRYLAGHSASQPHTVGTMYFGSISFSIAVYINLLSCLWFLAARLQGFSNSWLQSVNQEDMSDPGLPSARQFLAAVYLVTTIITTVGLGDVLPTSDGERVLAMFTMLAGSVFLSFLVSVLVDTMAALSQEQQHVDQYRSRLQAVDAWMQDMQLPDQLVREVYSYYNSTWLQQQEDQQLWTDCLQGLPVQLRAEVSHALLQPVLSQLEVFQGLTPHQIRQVVVHLRAQRLAPASYLCLQGDEMDGIWILEEGQLDLIHDGVWQCTISAPEVVGLGALLTLLGSSAAEVEAAVRRRWKQQQHHQHQDDHHQQLQQGDLVTQPRHAGVADITATAPATAPVDRAPAAGDSSGRPYREYPSAAEEAAPTAPTSSLDGPQQPEQEPQQHGVLAAGRLQVPPGQHRFRPYTLRCRGPVSAWQLPMPALESLVVRFPGLQERLLRLWEERWASGLDRGPDV